MATRKNTNPRWDIAPQLQTTLNANGMQAHLAQDAAGNYQLITMAHNTSTPRYYQVSERQVENLRNGGTNFWNKKAYETFTSIVGKDYYMPGSWVAAKNANSPVNNGLWGHTIGRGEYGYRGGPRFRPFVGARYGMFNSFLPGYPGMGPRGFHIRRVEGRPFFAYSAPAVMDRPDGRLKPGELKSGSYGFYDKGNQQTDVLDHLEIKIKPKILVRPKGQSEPLDKVMGSNLYPTSELFQHMLASHGVIINEKDKTLTIKSSSVNKDLQYKLMDEELEKLLAENFKHTDNKGNKGKNGVTVDERIAILNKVIEGDFADKITRASLNTKDYVDIKLRPEKEKEIYLEQEAALKNAQMMDIIHLKEPRQDYHTGFIDKWNSIGVVDGRMLSLEKGFYLPNKDGRRVSVGEIQAYPIHNGEKTSFRMTAVINNQVMSREISKEDYLRFINYDDEHRLELFDKIFDEVKIKSSNNGRNEDGILSGNIDTANGVVKLTGNYSLVNSSSKAIITSAMAWKDQISGNYLINMRDSKDVGMWSFKISEEQYLRFKNATNDERAKMLTEFIPIRDEQGNKLQVVKDLKLPLSHAEQNLDTGMSNERLSKGVGLKGIPAEGLSKQDLHQLTLMEDKMKGNISLEQLRKEAKIALSGDAAVNGESLQNLKTSKEWKRSGEHGRSTMVSDIAVERLRDAEGKVIEGRYKMSAVIDGNVFSHEITQKDFNKFLAVNDYQRMKLFDKIFPEVQMQTKTGHGFNLGAAIFAAVTTGLDVMAGLSMPPRPRPEIYEQKSVYFKPGVVSAAEVAAAKYENFHHEEGLSRSEGRGMGI